jgi:phosphomannomutase/phosphoglucomutase
MGQRKLKVVVDAGNGVGGMVGPAVLRALGVDVKELYCEPDGKFPNHHPDPTVMENVEDLIEAVKTTGADFGIGWDGDADRIGVVDEKGNVIFGDMLVLLYGRAILEEKPGATIIGDVKCSSRLFDDLRARGANAIMWKTGHSLIKSKLKETHGDLAGEMSGHIFFKHRYFGFDDALYASCRLVEIVSKASGPLSTLLSDLKHMESTPEIRFDCPEQVKFQIAREAQAAFSEYNVDTTDGVRITFDKGWGLVRASNTQPVLVMRFEAESPELLEQYESLVRERIEGIKARLSR